MAYWSLNQEDPTIFDHFPANLKRAVRLGKAEKMPSLSPGFDFLLRFCKTGAFSIKSFLYMKIWTVCAFWPLNHEDPTFFEHLPANLKWAVRSGKVKKMPSARPGFDFFLRFCKTGAYIK